MWTKIDKAKGQQVGCEQLSSFTLCRAIMASEPGTMLGFRHEKGPCLFLPLLLVLWVICRGFLGKAMACFWESDVLKPTTL